VSKSADDRFAYSEGELSVFDPETGETTRIGEVPAEYRDRPITEDDVAAAARGLRLSRMSRAELVALEREHAAKPLFASRVVAEAARRAARRAIR
jgi:hypothetical protein